MTPAQRKHWDMAVEDELHLLQRGHINARIRYKHFLTKLRTKDFASVFYRKQTCRIHCIAAAWTLRQHLRNNETN